MLYFKTVPAKGLERFYIMRAHIWIVGVVGLCLQLCLAVLVGCAPKLRSSHVIKARSSMISYYTNKNLPVAVLINGEGSYKDHARKVRQALESGSGSGSGSASGVAMK
ncbi:uncharacterized protein LOC110249857 [Exaiptasia diaphana]|uniref:Uncharacterized protein n=1 Tax=Exaiptasia diaphana TaxID=2652724 RepID=A0A913YVZ3_EXADI|nr:uncharacterized protein LOC110249857 [Exaiptasia diaphana]